VVAQIGALGSGASHSRPVIRLSAGRAGEGQNNALEHELWTAAVILSLFVLGWLSRVVLSGRPLFHGLRSLAHDSRTGAKRQIGRPGLLVTATAVAELDVVSSAREHDL
jgi:hypothetical protein